jgi:hypothetical protein
MGKEKVIKRKGQHYANQKVTKRKGEEMAGRGNQEEKKR